MIPIKTPDQIKTMRQSGQILARVLDLVISKVTVGVSTKELDELAEKEIRSSGGFPIFKGYHGFPTALCTCLNSEIVHAPAKPGRILKDGDILSIDVGIRYPAKHGMITDMAFTVAVGKISQKTKKLIQVTREALNKAIDIAGPNVYLGDLSTAIQTHVEQNSFNVVRELVGHGVGEKLHEEPQVANFGEPGTGPLLKPGMTLAIEPMVTAGDYLVQENKKTGAFQTIDGSLSAHFEHTVLITEQGSEILTKL